MSRDLEQPILVKNLLKSLESLIPGSIRPSRPTSSTDLPDHLQRHDLSRSSALFNLRCLYRANGSLQCALIDAAPPVCRLPLVLACRRRVCVGVSAAEGRIGRIGHIPISLFFLFKKKYIRNTTTTTQGQFLRDMMDFFGGGFSKIGRDLGM